MFVVITKHYHKSFWEQILQPKVFKYLLKEIILEKDNPRIAKDFIYQVIERHDAVRSHPKLVKLIENESLSQELGLELMETVYVDFDRDEWGIVSGEYMNEASESIIYTGKKIRTVNHIPEKPYRGSADAIEVDEPVGTV